MKYEIIKVQGPSERKTNMMWSKMSAEMSGEQGKKKGFAASRDFLELTHGLFPQTDVKKAEQVLLVDRPTDLPPSPLSTFLFVPKEFHHQAGLAGGIL